MSKLSYTSLDEIWHTLRHLVEEIGPRPAGSPAEAETINWLEGELTQFGYDSTRYSFPFQSIPAYFPYNSIPALGFTLAGFLLPQLGWIVFFLPLLVFILPEFVMALQRRLLPYKDSSTNLLALPSDTPLEQIDLILCAHVDTARAIPRGPGFWQRWRDEIAYTMMRVSVFLTIIGAMVLAGFGIPGLVITLAQTISFAMSGLLFVQDLWEQVGSMGKFTHGANDNASGIAVLQRIAKDLSINKPNNLKVGFLFTGAEECGLHGARHFAAYLVERRLKPIVISVDMVGAGDGLRIIKRCGTIRPTYSNSDINEILKRADPLAKYHEAPRRWGDFVPFSQAGIPAGHLENTGTPHSWATYHTGDDGLDVIDPDLLEHTVEVLKQAIWILDKNMSNPEK
jgi:hypothetical protein